jgi:putative tricarboxylic transport membrane protein
MAFAMTLGIVVGALPGLSATIGIALLTGITYSFSKNTAMIMMIGLYIGAIYAGSLSAILINIPGTGSAAATCLDGYPLAKKGMASDAIMVSRTGSFLGSLVGLIIFLFLTPLIRRIALSFTSAEYFWLSIFGVLICGTLASRDFPVKGWIAGLIGMMISFIGMEDIHSYARFTFGSLHLVTGVPWVPLMIGIFGIPQIVNLIRQPGQTQIVAQAKVRIRIFKVLKRNLFRILEWVAIGTGIGALPGVGENIAAWVAYGVAKNESKESEKWGTGVIEGVLAPEVANNAAIFGALITLLTLGVPGSPPTAILMGALRLHGLRPGPMLMYDDPGFIYEMGGWLFWGTVMLFVIGLITAKPMSLILKVPPKILAPLIGVLCIVGTYTVSTEIFDLKLVVLFGFIGYILDKYGYNRGPLILGVILGPLTDANFRRVMHLNDGNPVALINRPISILFFISIVVMILYKPLKRLWKKSREKRS